MYVCSITSVVLSKNKIKEENNSRIIFKFLLLQLKNIDLNIYVFVLIGSKCICSPDKYFCGV